MERSLGGFLRGGTSEGRGKRHLRVLRQVSGCCVRMPSRTTHEAFSRAVQRSYGRVPQGFSRNNAWQFPQFSGGGLSLRLAARGQYETAKSAGSGAALPPLRAPARPLRCSPGAPAQGGPGGPGGSLPYTHTAADYTDPAQPIAPITLRRDPCAPTYFSCFSGC